MLTNSSILITGGTGSFGNTFVPITLAKYNPRRLVIYSRDEMKQWDTAHKFEGDARVRFFSSIINEPDPNAARRVNHSLYLEQLGCGTLSPRQRVKGSGSSLAGMRHVLRLD